VTWWRRLISRRRLETDLDRELRDHLERQVADFVREGMTESEARRRAALMFGGVEGIKESCRDARGTRWLIDLADDVRYSLRVFAHSPGFVVVSVLSLALGIGANTAIFSIVNSLLLRSLPVRDPRQLAILIHGSWTNPIWEQVRERQSLFDGATAFSSDEFDLASGGPADPVEGLWTSGSFFNVMGVPAILGRTYGVEDDRRNGGSNGAVAVLGYSFWQRRFGGAPDVIGRSIMLNRVPYTIVGVTPPDFLGPTVGNRFDVAVPIATEPLMRGKESWLDGRSTWWLDIMVRRKPGQSVDDAIAALRAVQPQIKNATIPLDWPKDDQARYLKEPFILEQAAGGSSNYRERYREPLIAIMITVALVLLIACANIANLMLARASARRHEMGLRIALGASRLRIARQMITESLLLSGAGAALGLLLATWGSAFLVRELTTFRDNVTLDLTLDWRILAFTAVAAVATALLFGVVPAFRAGQVEPNEALKDGSRTVAGTRSRALGQPLVVVQVALSLVLVVAAGLFLRTFTSLTKQRLGYDTDRLLLVSVDPQKSGVDESRRPALYEQMRAAAAAVPGVSSAALSAIPPMSGMGWNNTIEAPGQPAPPVKDRTVWYNGVSSGWFATYGVKLVAGRDFAAADRDGTPGVAIVNQALAKLFFPGKNPVGRILRQTWSGSVPAPAPWQIVGVVTDAAYRSLRETAPPTLYLAFDQSEARTWPNVSLTVRSAAGPPAAIARSVSAAVTAAAPGASLTQHELNEQVSGLAVSERIVAMLSGFFGALALLLASIGLYGVTSYGVNSRRTEIGIRIALGADTSSVVLLILRRMALLIGLGIVAGALVSLWASRYVGSMLYGLDARDPLTFAGAAVTLALVGAVAAWLPARRATRIDPCEVLRQS
jgi:putative ABC transport system permease protein